MSALLEARGLTVAAAGRVLCRALDLRIEPGQSWAVLGRNGAGKTSLLHHLAGLAAPAGGEVLLDGAALRRLPARARARSVGVLLQHSSPGFGAPVLDMVLAGRHPHLGALAWEGTRDLAIARRCMQTLDLEALADRPGDRLSGGELRRVEIARLLAQQPRLALLDEPLNHLDLAHRGVVMAALRDACVGPQRALMMALHDLDLAYRACDQWLLLHGDGAWQAGPRARLADPELLGRVFGCRIARVDSELGPMFLARD